MKKKNTVLQTRLRVLFGLIVLSLIAISIRLCQVQIIESTKYSHAAEKQRNCEIEIPPERGAILDRNGTELGVSVIMDTIYATPYLIDDPKKFAHDIAPIIKVDERKLIEKLIRQHGFTYLIRKTDAKTVSAVKNYAEKENIKGIGYIKESKRYYPNASLAGHVLGFTGVDNHGLSGIELYYDDILFGKPGKIVGERDAHGRPIPQTILKSYKPVDGATVRLTLDKEIQYKAEEYLEQAIKENEAKAGSIIVMDAKNGEIYAMANLPCFNPNDLKTLNDSNSRNRAITDIYEPGSTMKTIIACGALEQGICSPNTAFYLEPSIKVGWKRIKDSHPRPAKTFTFSQIIQESSNVGMVKVGLMMGKDMVIDYLDRFGFNKKTGVDYPGEAKSFYPNPENWSKITLANIPFGQGLCTTQIQMIRAYSAIGNNGVPATPHFLIEAKDKRGRLVKVPEEKKEKRILDEKSCEQMKIILEKTVLEGTGSQAKVPFYRVGGKTGTAQKAKLNGRGYEKGKYIASFIGMVPIQNPKIIISVVIDEPKTSIYGGSVAAPVFSKVAEFSLRHLKIPPE